MRSEPGGFDVLQLHVLVSGLGRGSVLEQQLPHCTRGLGSPQKAWMQPDRAGEAWPLLCCSTGKPGAASLPFKLGVLVGVPLPSSSPLAIRAVLLPRRSSPRLLLKFIKENFPECSQRCHQPNSLCCSNKMAP